MNRHPNDTRTWRAALLLPMLIGLAAPTAEAQQTYTALDQRHLRLVLRVDIDRQAIDGDATYRLDPGGDSLDSLVVRSNGLRIDSILVGPADSALVVTPYVASGRDSITVSLDTLAYTEGSFDIRIVYGAQPKRGLYFASTREATPPSLQVWTDGRRDALPSWIPIIASGTDNLTAAITLIVPESVTVHAAGRRASEPISEDGSQLFNYLVERPVVPEHLTFFIGRLEDVRETAPVSGNAPPLPVTYAIDPSQLGNVRRTFGHVPDLLRSITAHVGHEFPWDAYTIVSAGDPPDTLVAGAGLTQVSDRTILDARAVLSESADLTLALALTKQWYGVHVTPASPIHRWITDGLAWYVAALTIRDVSGADAFDLLLRDLRAHSLYTALDADYSLIRDPADEQEAADENRASYKAAWFFRMLHAAIGDAAFDRFLGTILDRYGSGVVTTEDLEAVVASFDRSTATRLFDEWVYGAGYPVLALSYSFDPDREALTVHVEQRPPETSSVSGQRAVFHGPLTVEVFSLSESFRFTFDLDEETQQFIVPFAAFPRFVVVDPDQEWLAEVTLEQDARAWMSHVRLARSPASRLEAAQVLGASGDDPALAIGLRSALTQESSPVVRAGIIAVLGGFAPTTAIERTLQEALTDEDARVRAAAIYALGAYPSPSTHDLAFDRAQNDPSYDVQADAVRTLARIGSSDALDVIRSALITPAHRDVIRVAALDALEDLDLSAREWVELVAPLTDPGHTREVRVAATEHLLPYLATSRLAMNRVTTLLADDDVRVRRAAIRALGHSRQDRALRALSDRLAEEPEPDLRRAIAHALSAAESR